MGASARLPVVALTLSRRCPEDTARLPWFQRAPLLDLSARPVFSSGIPAEVMNLTTVRSHQFAVWLMIGFFAAQRCVAGCLASNLNLFKPCDLLVKGEQIENSRPPRTLSCSSLKLDRLTGKRHELVTG